MLKNIKYLKLIRDCTIAFIGMYCILMITSKNFLKTSTIILETDNIAWVLQLYLGYMYFAFGRKKRKWINLFLMLLIPYLILTTADTLNITEISFPLSLCLGIFIFSILFYVYLRLKIRQPKITS